MPVAFEAALRDATLLLATDGLLKHGQRTRWDMQGLVLDMLRRSENTVLFVTHDVSEAVYLADVIYLLSSRPAQILHRVDVPFFADRSFAVKSSPEFRKVEDQLLSFLHGNPKVQGNIRVGV